GVRPGRRREDRRRALGAVRSVAPGGPGARLLAGTPGRPHFTVSRRLTAPSRRDLAFRSVRARALAEHLGKPGALQPVRVGSAPALDSGAARSRRRLDAAV